MKGLKSQQETFSTVFQLFYETTSKSNHNVVSGIQYYYECRSSAGQRTLHADVTIEPEGEAGEAVSGAMASGDSQVVVAALNMTESQLESFIQRQKNPREEQYAHAAVIIGQRTNMFGNESEQWTPTSDRVIIACTADHEKIQRWQAVMTDMVHNVNEPMEEELEDGANRDGEVTGLEHLEETYESEGGVEAMEIDRSGEETMTPLDVSDLRPDQRRAHDIVHWHLKETLGTLVRHLEENNHQKNAPTAVHAPEQLLMVMPGEGGVGKSRTIQAITKTFMSCGVGHMLVKSALTGIAATVIEGKTVHIVAQLPVNRKSQSQKANRKLVQFWQDKKYLIIDEMSMLACHNLARVSAAISTAKSSTGMAVTGLPFGGVNVILVGDFHQFAPVGGKPLYREMNTAKASADNCLGRAIYKHFKTVVHLKEQVRVTDSKWLDVLQHVRKGVVDTSTSTYCTQSP